MTTPTLTVAIPCYRQAGHLARLLASLADLPATEILVLDDGSPEPVSIPSADSRVRLIRHPTNRGLGAARNSLARAAQGELIGYFDADVALASWSARLPAAFDDDPTLAAVTGRAFEAGGGSAADRWRRWFWIQDHGPQPVDVEYAYGLCCVWRRRAVLELGGFDERLRTHGEDIDLSFRARARGWRLAHDPQLTVTHHRQDSLSSLLRMVWHHSYGFSAVCRNHRHPLYRRALVNAVKWLPVTVVSSLRRHHDLRLAAISLAAGTLSIVARLCALAATPRSDA